MKSFFLVLCSFVLWSTCAIRLQAQSFAFTTPVGSAAQSGTADGTNGVARFYEPGGIAADSSGNLYVADTANHAIRRITRTGTGWVVKTLAGLPGTSGSRDGSNSVARFYYPYGIAVDHSGLVYVADTYNHTIRKLVQIGTNWAVSTLAGSAGTHGTSNGSGTSANFYYPYGIATDQAGYVYVADSYNHTIRQVSPDGDAITIAGTAGTDGIANGTNTSAQFYYPSGIAADNSGNLFVADTFNSIIREIMPIGTDWVVTTIAGIPRYRASADGTNRSAQFNYPFGISVGGPNALYVADTLNHTLRVMNPMGTNWVVNTVGGLAGSAGSADGIGTAAQFDDPYGLAVDSTGNLYVADTYNNTIRFGQAGFVLQAALVPGQIVVSWPLAASNYVLQTSGSPGSGSSWSSISVGIVVSGNSFVKTNPVSPGQAFFRLHSL